MKTSSLLGTLSIAFLTSSLATAAPPTWVGSGENLVWDNQAGTPTPNLLGGTGKANGALYQNTQSTDYSPVPLPTGSPTTGTQYFCYAVDGNKGSPVFVPNNFSFVCSETTPTTDNAPSAALQPDAVYTVATSQAGFLGSMVNLNTNANNPPTWQPWFRNGESVLFDMPQQVPVSMLLPPNPPNPPPPQLGPPPTIDPSFKSSVVYFNNGGLTQETVTLPGVFGTGDIIELQIANYSLATAQLPNFNVVLPAVQIQILAQDATKTTRAIGEATVGPINFAAGQGYPRMSSYHLDASDLLWTNTVNRLVLDVSATPTPIQPQQVVMVRAVLHGYHEQLLK